MKIGALGQHRVIGLKRHKILLALHFVSLVTTAVSAWLFLHLDQVVHGVLYRYGLQFSYEWAGPYWIFARMILALLSTTIALCAISITLTLTNQRADEIGGILSSRGSPKVSSTIAMIWALVSSGVLIAIFSISVSSSVLALLGLDLIFWGAILLYIRPEKYVKETLFRKTTTPLLADLGRIIEETGYKGTPVFLPPTLGDSESSKVYIGTEAGITLPSPEGKVTGEKAAFSHIFGAKGILLTPTGVGLAELIEERIGKNLKTGNLEHLGRELRKVLVEDLEITQAARTQTSSQGFRIRMKGSVYSNICRETGLLEKFRAPVGCPLCSAIACVLAKFTGKPVTIEGNPIHEDGQVIDVEYRIL